MNNQIRDIRIKSSPLQVGGERTDRQTETFVIWFFHFIFIFLWLVRITCYCWQLSSGWVNSY